MCWGAMDSPPTTNCSVHGNQPSAVLSQGGGALPGACGSAEKRGEPWGMQRCGRRIAQQQPRAVPASCRSMMLYALTIQLGRCYSEKRSYVGRRISLYMVWGRWRFCRFKSAFSVAENQI